MVDASLSVVFLVFLGSQISELIPRFNVRDSATDSGSATMNGFTCFVALPFSLGSQALHKSAVGPPLVVPLRQHRDAADRKGVWHAAGKVGVTPRFGGLSQSWRKPS